MMNTSRFQADRTVSRRQAIRLAAGLAGVLGLGAVGISSVRAKHSDDDFGDDDWMVGAGGSGGSGSSSGLDDDWVFGSGGSGGSGDWVFGSGGLGGSGGSGGSGGLGGDDWFDD